jgi:precorrin-2 dehydrogenase / sirohydrochlorin ferrochelatase
VALKYMPINVNLKDAKVLVVGGGSIALRKVEHLLEYDCEVTVVAPKVVDKIQYYGDHNRIKLENREYISGESGKYRIVISATDDSAINEAVRKDCEDAGILVNVVDNPRLCTFTVPAVVRRGPLSITVSTDGKAPFLAGGLRVILNEFFGPHWERIADAAAVFRKKVREKYEGDAEQQGRCFERFLGQDWQEILKNKSHEELEQALDKLL